MFFFPQAAVTAVHKAIKNGINMVKSLCYLVICGERILHEEMLDNCQKKRRYIYLPTIHALDFHLSAKEEH